MFVAHLFIDLFILRLSQVTRSICSIKCLTSAITDKNLYILYFRVGSFSMSYCNCEWEDVYIKERIISPHCDTCQCRRSELEVRSKIRRPLSNIPRSISVRSSRPCLADVIHCCSCNCIRDCDLCLCYECRKILGRSEASIHRRESRLRFPEHKCSLLQSWFTK